MRTTLNLDNDVLEQARLLAQDLRQPFKYVVNEALRSGLKQIEKPLQQKTYCTVPQDMKIRKGLCLDSIPQLISEVEGEDHL